jgi:hypothetical protein
MRRLDQLAMEAARELQVEKQSDIFLWTERLEYRYALLEAWRGFENARIALAKARRRLEGQGELNSAIRLRPSTKQAHLRRPLGRAVGGESLNAAGVRCSTGFGRPSNRGQTPFCRCRPCCCPRPGAAVNSWRRDTVPAVRFEGRMLEALMLIWVVLSLFGPPLVGVGAVLWLCERSWGKRPGRMSSLWLLAIGAILCLPVLLYLGPALCEYLLRSVAAAFAH